MDNKDDKTRIDNPFDESFYIIPEEEVESASEDNEGCTFINLAGVSDKEEFHARIREALDVPDYYGDNLDALYDVLTEDISKRIIRISGANKVAENMRDYIGRFRLLCDDVNDESESVTIVFDDDKI